MMKKIWFFPVLIFLFALTTISQEVVVFSDDRSMTVKSHREKDGFVYLQLQEGEIAVPKKQIKEVRKESVAVISVSNVDSPKLPPGMIEKPGLPDRKKPIQPLRNVISKRLQIQPAKDEDADNDSEADNQDDDDEPPPPPSLDDSPRPLMPMRLPTAPDDSDRAPRISPINRKR